MALELLVVSVPSADRGPLPCIPSVTFLERLDFEIICLWSMPCVHVSLVSQPTKTGKPSVRGRTWSRSTTTSKRLFSSQSLLWSIRSAQVVWTLQDRLLPVQVCIHARLYSSVRSCLDLGTRNCRTRHDVTSRVDEHREAA